MLQKSQWRVRGSSSSNHPWFLSVRTQEKVPDFLSEESQAAHIISDNYNRKDIIVGSTDHARLQRMMPNMSAPGFFIVYEAGFYSNLVIADEKSCLQFLLSPQDFGAFTSCTVLYSFLWGQDTKELKHETEQSSTSNQFECLDSQEKGTSDKPQCILSIRLMEGGSAKAGFNYTDSLMDVKRWLQQELKLLLVPEDDMTNSRYNHIGHFEPSRYAFFYPATRKTFTEAQEFLKLEDLGLCPRLALILRPDYDEIAMKAAREDKSSWRKVLTDFTNLLHALYSFFDYGVDDATRDMQDTFDQQSIESLEPPHFLGSTGPAPPSASLIQIRSEDSVLREETSDPCHTSLSQARGEIFGGER